MDWQSRTVQLVPVPGSRRGHQDGTATRFAIQLRREARQRGLVLTATVAASQDSLHVRILGSLADAPQPRSPRVHIVALLFNAGLNTYTLRCMVCGDLRGVYTTRRDAEAAASAHRRSREVQ